MPRRPSDHIDDPKALGLRLRQARLAAKLTQRALAFEGCTSAYVSRVEAGVRTPSFQVIREWSRRIGVNADWLATGQEPGAAARIQDLVVDLAQLYPEEQVDEELSEHENALIEHIGRRREELRVEESKAIQLLRQTLEGTGVSQDEIEQIVQRLLDSLRSAPSKGAVAKNRAAQ